MSRTWPARRRRVLPLPRLRERRPGSRGSSSPATANESYEWLDQTRQMFARHELRVRHIDYENAPSGREVFAASPYRWWLGFVALTYHGITRAASGPSLEWAALYADPLLLLIFGAATVAFVAWRFGALAAALTSAALATLFPFAAEFVPGIPDDLGLALAFAVWSVLPLVAGASKLDALDSGRSTGRWFLAGGVIGGIGLWINVSRQFPILAGIAVGALLAAWISRIAATFNPALKARPLPWRAWGIAGATTCLAGYLLEYFPSYLGTWELHAIHPIFGLAWLGAGELLARLAAWIGGEKPRWNVRSVACWILAVAALASLPVAMRIVHDLGFLSIDLPTMRLSLPAESPAAPTLWAWLLQNGFTAAAWATVLPLLILVPAAALLMVRLHRPFAPGPDRPRPGACAGRPGIFLQADQLGGTAWMPHCWSCWSPAPRPRAFGRDLGSWPAAPPLSPRSSSCLAQSRSGRRPTPGSGRASARPRSSAWSSGTWPIGFRATSGPAGASSLAPPNVTATLYYYGGLKGLASFSWEDRDGFQAAVRILSATTPEEAQELIGIHGVTPHHHPLLGSLHGRLRPDRLGPGVGNVPRPAAPVEPAPLDQAGPLPRAHDLRLRGPSRHCPGGRGRAGRRDGAQPHRGVFRRHGPAHARGQGRGRAPAVSRRPWGAHRPRAGADRHRRHGRVCRNRWT